MPDLLKVEVDESNPNGMPIERCGLCLNEPTTRRANVVFAPCITPNGGVLALKGQGRKNRRTEKGGRTDEICVCM